MSDLAVNARARFDYDVLETFGAGIVLSGHEVKSAKRGHLNLAGSRAVIRGGEPTSSAPPSTRSSRGMSPTGTNPAEPESFFSPALKFARSWGNLRAG